MPRRFVLYIVLIFACSAHAAQQIDLAALGPQVGDRVPEFTGVDQFGRTQTLATVSGPRGAMIVFYRSADW